MLLQVQLPICQQWFIQWLGAQQVTRYYLNQWWQCSSYMVSLGHNELIHWGQVMHIQPSLVQIITCCLVGRRQAIICTNAGILLIGPLGTNISEMLIEILIFSFKKMHLKITSAKWWPFYLSLNVLMWLECMHAKRVRQFHWYHRANPLLLWGSNIS